MEGLNDVSHHEANAVWFILSLVVAIVAVKLPTVIVRA
jgi:hypothetical protein